MHAVLAHRAEQGFGEPAVAATAYHQQIGVTRCVEQDPGGIAHDGAGVHRHVTG